MGEKESSSELLSVQGFEAPRCTFIGSRLRRENTKVARSTYWNHSRGMQISDAMQTRLHDHPLSNS